MKKTTFLMAFLLLISWQGMAQFTEDFEGTFLPTGWTTQVADLSNDITQSTTDNHTPSGANSVRFSSFSTSGDYNQYLFSQQITVTAPNTELRFWHVKSGANAETLEWGVSTTTADTTSVSTWNPITLNTAWTEEIIDLSSYVGQTIYFSWHYYGNYQFYVYLDDVSLGVPPSCPDPSNLSVSSITSTSADLDWTENGSAMSWQIEWDTTNFVPGTGNLEIAPSKPHSLPVLSSDTGYDYYVRAICGAGDTSAWVGPYNFFTGYCVPSSSGSSTYIDNFTTSNGSNNISNLASGFTTGGYFDGTAQAVESFATGTFDFNAEIVGGTAGFSIWVDWNNDMVFDDVTEKVFNTTTYGNGPFNGSITVPGAASIGDYRMRVTTDWNQSNPSLPCAAQSTAEFEDYTITVGAPPSCLPPTNLTAINIDDNSADLDWTENGSAMSWQIEWDTTNFAPGSGNLEIAPSKPHNISGLTMETSYDYYVRAICGAGDTSVWAGPYSFTTTCVAPVISSFPWTENFDAETTPEMPCGWFVDNVNADAYTWGTGTNAPNSGVNAMEIRWNSAEAANDWAFTPELSLTGSVTYQLTFAFRSGGTTFPEKMKVMLGADQTSASMTDLLFDSTFTNTTYDTATVMFTPPSSGSYYVGFHNYSDADMFRVYVDDVTIDIATSIVANVNDKNINIFPNPTTGVFTITGDLVNATVNVINIQGKSVYQNSLANNNTTIDLRNNAKGLYFVSITTENGVETYKVIIE